MLLVSRRHYAAALTLAWALPSGLALASPQTPAPANSKGAAVESWAIDDATTSVTFDVATLGLLGVTVKRVGNVRENHLAHHLSVAPADAPWLDGTTPTALKALMAHDGFRGFAGGALTHRGGFLLGAPGGTIDLSRLTLRPGADPKVLELVDAKGTAWLATAAAQWELERADDVVRYLNADVVILPGLARRLGHESYTGMTVGVLALDATLHPGKIPAALAPIGNAPPGCGVWDGKIDVGLTDMTSIGQAGIATVNGRSVVVVLPSADLKNVGTGNVPWFSKFTNLGVPPWNDQHPFLVWQMTRVLNGIYEPLGRSDLKHAFLTLNTGCDAGACTDSHILGLGCSDVYGTSTNNSVGSLAPRSEITASTGLWNHCGGVPSHFDTNGDCVQDFSGSGENAFTHGLKAAETDLQTAGATYFVEAFYIVRNDINIFNSMGYRQVTPTKPAAVWMFPVVGAYAQGPAVNAWVNPVTPGANAANNILDTREGHVQLAVKVTDIAGGKKTFAYALQNHDFDRRISSFHLAFDGTVGVVENIGYHDGDGFAANDWAATVDATGITWTAPSGTTPPAEIDYASVVSFHFDSDRPVAPSTSTLVPTEAGATSTLSIATLAPASSSADLSITKTDGVTTAPPGGSVTYTITSSNAGPSNVTGATVTDTFPASLTCTWTCVGAGGGTCTASGSGNINDTANLPTGGSTTYTASCTISSAATGTLSNVSTVTAPGGVLDPTPGDNSATDSDTLVASADLAITKTDGVTLATIGGSVTYTITSSNAGPSNATGAAVADTFPASLTCTWTCVGAGGGTCTASGSGNINATVNLPSGGSVTHTANCTISPSATGTLSNTSTVAAPAGVTDPTPGNNSATDSDTLVGPPGYGYYTVPPCRLLDTRTPAGGAAPIPNNTERSLDVVAAACGVPAGAIGVALNVTAVGSTVSGEVAIYALGEPATHGVVDFPAGRTRANNGLARLSAAGKLGIKPLLSGPGSTHVIVDVMGYFGPP